MLVGGESASIDVKVRVYLYGGDVEAHGLEQGPQTACDDPLPHSTDDTTAHEDVLHRVLLLIKLSFTAGGRHSHR